MIGLPNRWLKFNQTLKGSTSTEGVRTTRALPNRTDDPRTPGSASFGQGFVEAEFPQSSLRMCRFLVKHPY